MPSTILNGKREKSYDEVQLSLLKENLILVDAEDNAIGSSSKKNCHLWNNISKGLLHRAFSVFLFTTSDELILQRRSLQKIIFPDFLANTCCSHPLNNEVEANEKDAVQGVKMAAVRKLNQELGITQINVTDLTYLTRILYKARSDEEWGEHEIDYILFARKDVEISPNPNEVSQIIYLKRDQLDKISDFPKVSPWFKLICDNFLPLWWDNLENIRKFQETHAIHKLT